MIRFVLIFTAIALMSSSTYAKTVQISTSRFFQYDYFVSDITNEICSKNFCSGADIGVKKKADNGNFRKAISIFLQTDGLERHPLSETKLTIDSRTSFSSFPLLYVSWTHDLSQGVKGAFNPNRFPDPAFGSRSTAGFLRFDAYQNISAWNISFLGTVSNDGWTFRSGTGKTNFGGIIETEIVVRDVLRLFPGQFQTTFRKGYWKKAEDQYLCSEIELDDQGLFFDSRNIDCTTLPEYPSPVPLPATLGMLAVAIGFLGLYRRRS